MRPTIVLFAVAAAVGLLSGCGGGELQARAMDSPTADGQTAATQVRTGASSSSPAASRPSNVLGWTARGSASRGPALDTVARAYARQVGAARAEVVALFSGDTDAGVRFLVGQAWVEDSPAQTIGYIERPGREGELHIQPATPAGAPLVALLITEQPGTTTDLLVVVPAPGTTSVAYSASAGSAWHVATSGEYLEGVALVDRDVRATEDRIRLTGSTTVTVAVSRALCDGDGCA